MIAVGLTLGRTRKHNPDIACIISDRRCCRDKVFVDGGCMLKSAIALKANLDIEDASNGSMVKKIVMHL